VSASCGLELGKGKSEKQEEEGRKREGGREGGCMYGLEKRYCLKSFSSSRKKNTTGQQQQKRMTTTRRRRKKEEKQKRGHRFRVREEGRRRVRKEGTRGTHTRRL